MTTILSTILSTISNPGVSYGIIHLDLFDTVHFDKQHPPRLNGGTLQNYFTIEKINDL